MNDVIKNYIQNANKEFEEVRKEIRRREENFKSIIWTDEISMIKVANEIWRLESRLNDAIEIHNKILKMVGEE